MPDYPYAPDWARVGSAIPFRRGPLAGEIGVVRDITFTYVGGRASTTVTIRLVRQFVTATLVFDFDGCRCTIESQLGNDEVAGWNKAPEVSEPFVTPEPGPTQWERLE